MQPLWQIEGQILIWIQNNLRQDWLTPIMRILTMFGDYGAVCTKNESESRYPGFMFAGG